MRAPEFWQAGRGASLALPLMPLTWGWRAAAHLRRTLTSPYRPPVPLVCVGNIVAGGAGKTPTAIAVTRWFQARGLTVHVLTRGYGGRLSGQRPHRVDPAVDDAAAVGDEALLHAMAAPTFIAADRAAGARAAAAGAGLIVMDDGHQNPTVARDLSLVVVDTGFGFGNGRIMPAGPLREAAAAGLARANAVVAIGGGEIPPAVRESGRPVLRARIVPGETAMHLSGRRTLAFTGIGRPAKFVETLTEMGCSVVGLHAYADHHRFRPDEIMLAVEAAAAADAVPVTTAKDFVRLPAEARRMVEVVDIRLIFERPELLDAVLEPVARLAHDKVAVLGGG